MEVSRARAQSVGGSEYVSPRVIKARAKAQAKDPSTIDLSKIAKKWEEAEAQLESLQQKAMPSVIALDETEAKGEIVGCLKGLFEQRDSIVDDVILTVKAKKAIATAISNETIGTTKRKKRFGNKVHKILATFLGQSSENTKLDQKLISQLEEILEQERRVQIAEKIRKQMDKTIDEIVYCQELTRKRRDWEGVTYFGKYKLPTVLRVTSIALDVAIEIGTVFALGWDAFSGDEGVGVEESNTTFLYTTMPESTPAITTTSKSIWTISFTSFSLVASFAKDYIDTYAEEIAKRAEKAENLLNGSEEQIQKAETQLQFWEVYHKLEVERRSWSKKSAAALSEVIHKVRAVCGKDNILGKLGMRFKWLKAKRGDSKQIPVKYRFSIEDKSPRPVRVTSEQKKLLYKRKIASKAKIKIPCCRNLDEGTFGITEIGVMSEQIKNATDELQRVINRLNGGENTNHPAIASQSSFDVSPQDDNQGISPVHPIWGMNIAEEIKKIRSLRDILNVVFEKLDGYDSSKIEITKKCKLCFARFRDVVKLTLFGTALSEISEALEFEHRTISEVIFSLSFVALIGTFGNLFYQQMRYQKLFEIAEVKRLLGMKKLITQLNELENLLFRLEGFRDAETDRIKQERLIAVTKILEPTQTHLCGLELCGIQHDIGDSQAAKEMMKQKDKQGLPKSVKNALRKVKALRLVNRRRATSMGREVVPSEEDEDYNDNELDGADYLSMAPAPRVDLVDDLEDDFEGELSDADFPDGSTLDKANEHAELIASIIDAVDGDGGREEDDETLSPSSVADSPIESKTMREPSDDDSEPDNIEPMSRPRSRERGQLKSQRRSSIRRTPNPFNDSREPMPSVEKVKSIMEKITKTQVPSFDLLAWGKARKKAALEGVSINGASCTSFNPCFQPAVGLRGGLYEGESSSLDESDHDSDASLFGSDTDPNDLLSSGSDCLEFVTESDSDEGLRGLEEVVVEEKE